LHAPLFAKNTNGRFRRNHPPPRGAHTATQHVAESKRAPAGHAAHATVSLRDAAGPDRLVPALRAAGRGA